LGLAFFFLHTRIDGREHYEVDSVLPLWPRSISASSCGGGASCWWLSWSYSLVLVNWCLFVHYQHVLTVLHVCAKRVFVRH
jgi:hypothetical protein